MVDAPSKPIRAVHPLSTVSARISLFTGNKKISTATCFTFNHEGSCYLVTNWHVVAGRNTYTGQPISNTGAVPDNLRIHVYSNSTYRIESHNLDTVAFRQHPKGQDVDVAVMPLKLPDELLLWEIPIPHEIEDFRVQPGAEVFVLGFPSGIKGHSLLPIWKRGTIASELPYSDSDPPYILLDTATREGMSGAPVYLYGSTMYLSESGVTGIGRDAFQFLGIYSGRFLGESEFSAQIGRVFLKSSIAETIEHGIPLTYELRDGSEKEASIG